MNQNNQKALAPHKANKVDGIQGNWLDGPKEKTVL